MGDALEDKISSLQDIHEKAACIWLFIRSRDNCKGAIAQYISQVISTQHDMNQRGEAVEKEFNIPEYLKNVIYYVTEE